jgi:hypothetical protein
MPKRRLLNSSLHLLEICFDRNAIDIICKWVLCNGIIFILYVLKVFDLSEILGFHGGDYEKLCFLECYAAWLL